MQPRVGLQPHLLELLRRLGVAHVARLIVSRTQTAELGRNGDHQSAAICRHSGGRDAVRGAGGSVSRRRRVRASPGRVGR
eukprot:1399525-Prymnesium_polylepis.2